MQTGDFVYIDFVGRIKGTGEIFDLTNEEIAKRENIHNPNLKYKPVLVVIDGDFVIAGLNETLKEMKIGEKRTVEIQPEKAFGERNTELIKLIPLSNFNNQDIDATPGSFVTINGIQGKVITVSGGRVRVDFNHPLAGKKLEYEVEIKNEVKDTVEKVYGIVNYFINIKREDVDVSISDNETQIVVKKIDIPKNTKQLIADTILKWIKEIQEIKFVDVFERTS